MMCSAKPSLLFSLLPLALLSLDGVAQSVPKTKKPAHNINNDLMEVGVKLKKASVLHVWMRAVGTGNQSASLHASFDQKPAPATKMQVMTTAETDYFVFQEIKLGKSGHCKLTWHANVSEVSYLYAYEPDKVKTKGIRPVYVRPKARHTPLLTTQSFHLRSPVGWMNDPNGFSRTNDGIYHVCYQSVVNINIDLMDVPGDAVEAMNWGHALSRDLVNWVHMPVFQLGRYHKNVSKPRNQWAENWYSGSAVPEGQHGFRAFATNFQNGRPDGNQQTRLTTRDGILPVPSEETVVIKTFPKNPTYNGFNLTLNPLNFRDPNVLKGPGGYYYMTLGTEDVQRGGAILLYRTKEPNNLDSDWEYQSVLLMDSRDDFGNIEVPGLIPLGNVSDPNTLYVLMYGREKGHVSVLYRLRDTIMKLGKFDGNKFEEIAEQTLDFAFGSYGHQGFYDPIGQQSLALGWNSWWNDWDQKSGFISSLSLPRQLKLAPNGTHILVGPHPNALAKLRGRKMVDQQGHSLLEGGEPVPLPDGMAYIRLPLNQSTDGYAAATIYLNISHPAYNELGVQTGPDGLELVKSVKVQEGPKDTRRLIAQGAKPDIVHVYIDRDSLEIYGEQLADGGMPRWLGTTRLTGNGTLSVQSVQLTEGMELVDMRKGGIWHVKVPKMWGAL